LYISSWAFYSFSLVNLQDSSLIIQGVEGIFLEDDHNNRFIIFHPQLSITPCLPSSKLQQSKLQKDCTYFLIYS